MLMGNKRNNVSWPLEMKNGVGEKKTKGNVLAEGKI